MIKKLWYIKSDNTDPYFNQGLEAYLFRKVGEDELIFYLWQNSPAVILGRNQNCWRECAVELMQAEGVLPARRNSGGGAVYHDAGNLNFTFCVRQADYDVARQLGVIIKALKHFGICAQKSGRNDVLAEGKKFSGNAFYAKGERCYHHGTIMVDVDKSRVSRYLKPSAAKLAARGVDSVRSRVINLQELAADLTIDKLCGALLDSLAQIYACPMEQLVLNARDRADIEEQRCYFADKDWIYGKGAPADIVLEKRFIWGELVLSCTLAAGNIRSIHISSDVMEADMIPVLVQALEGMPYDRMLMAQKLRETGYEHIHWQPMLEDISLWLQNIDADTQRRLDDDKI